MNELKQELSEADLANTIYLVTRALYRKGLFSDHPNNVIVEKLDGSKVEPCSRFDMMRQLKWAAKQGCFWFGGEVHSLKVILDRSPIKGYLELQRNRFIYVTCLNQLNFKHFEAPMHTLTESVQQSGMHIHFDQPCDSYNVTLTISADRLLSEQNVCQFLERIQHVFRILEIS